MYKIRRNLFPCPREFRRTKNVLGVSHKLLLTINKYYNYIINAQCNYYISNKGLLEECDKEENLEVNGLLIISV